MSEAPSNRWPVNQAALKWLREAKESPEPDASYLAQLAWWGVEKGGVEVPNPVAPSQPSPGNVENMLQRLAGASPGVASRWFLSSDDVPFREQADRLEMALQKAESPQHAAQIAMEVVYDLMEAENARVQA